MKRATTKQTPKGTRWGNEPKTYTLKDITTSVELIRELLMEVETIRARMEERKIDSVTLSGSSGAAAYDRAEGALKAWAGGLRKALHEHVKAGE